MRGAEEVFLTSTAGGLSGESIDGKSVGDGKVGPVTQRLNYMYWDHMKMMPTRHLLYTIRSLPLAIYLPATLVKTWRN